MARLIVVANRVPPPGDRSPRAGGLAVALEDALKPGSLWLGWSGETAKETSTTASLSERDGMTYATIDLSADDYKRFYVGFANGALWPLLHSRLGLIKFERSEFDGYMKVNCAFAEALKPLVRPGDVIWIHDYHFLPLGAELRRRGVRNPIGFFLHVPFVPARMFGVLPSARELLAAMLEFDLIAFQTREHLGDFHNAVSELLNATIAPDGRILAGKSSPLAIACPIGIDAQGFAKQAERAIRSRDTRRLVESLADRALIIGADRLDYSKGLINRFQAFGRFLARFPEHRLKVSYLQVAAISRAEVGDYQTLRRELDRLAGDINGRYAEFDWVPLRYMTRAITRTRLAGFYRHARVGLVTPLRDGMNLVAKEYVAAQNPEDPGVLVLSQFAGAAESMDTAVMVNPYDADQVAEALHVALTMPLDERKACFKSLFAHVCSVTAETYCRDFLAALARAANSRPTAPAVNVRSGRTRPAFG